MQKLSNIVVKNNQYWFQKKWPKDVKALLGKTSFSKKLNLSVNNANPLILEKHRSVANELFQLKVTMYRNSSPNALSANELAKLVIDELASRKLKPGHLESTDDGLDDEFGEISGYELNKGLANSLIPEANDIDWSIYTQGRLESDLTLQEQVTLMARSALLNRKIASPVTSESLWEEYYKHNELSLKSPRVMKKTQARWDKFSSYLGVHFLSETSVQSDIRPALNNYVKYLQESRQVKNSTIDRYLNDILAILNFGSEFFEFDWNIQKPKIGKVVNEPRKQFETTEQIIIAQLCLAQKGHKAKVALCILMYLQGGMMPSELERLRPEDIRLSGRYPCLVISQAAKTKDRQRVVPVVFGLEFIQEHIENTRQWLMGTTESNASRQMKTMLNMFVPHMPEQTAHCLRHTFEHNVICKEANSLNSALIAGWSGGRVGISDRMLKYGMGDMLNSEYLRSLYDTSRVINQHLLSVKPLANGDNVINLWDHNKQNSTGNV